MSYLEDAEEREHRRQLVEAEDDRRKGTYTVLGPDEFPYTDGGGEKAVRAIFTRDDTLAERLGGEHDQVVIDANWFQITYDEVRVSPNGDPIARYDPVPGVWFLNMAPKAPEGFSDVVFESR
jgi:hypothetical protein